MIISRLENYSSAFLETTKLTERFCSQSIEIVFPFTLMKNLPLIFMVFVFTLMCETASAQSAKSRPNIILILTDDQGYGDVGAHGNSQLSTPNLDRLAREGTSFSQFLTCPNCSPTRAGLLTGRYNYRTGVTEVLRGAYLMHSDELTIAEVLAKAGYRTGIFGKWHLGSNYPMRPTDQGFQEALVHKGGGIGQAAGPPGNSYFDPILEHNDVSKRYEGYCDDIFTDAAIEFASQDSEQPFFAYLATNLPHFPLVVPDELADPYRKMGLHEHNALTYGMIASIDYNVGRLLDSLDELGIAEDTIVIFMSDNGPRTRRTKNDVYPGRYVANLRGTKTSNYENGIKVPFFIRWPGTISAGKKVDTMATHVDVLPTILEATGVSPIEGRAIDGRSLMPLLNDSSSIDWPNRTVYFQWHSGPIPYEYVHFAARSEKYKLIQNQDNPHSLDNPPTTQEVENMLSSLELYDIENDPSELRNIAQDNPDVVDKMLEEYEAWFAEVTRERDYNNPERIQLGTPYQEHVILSRFDWRGPESKTRIGHWEVESIEEKKYRIALRFGPARRSGMAWVRYAGVTFSTKVRKGASRIVFEDIVLPAAKGRFEAFLKLE